MMELPLWLALIFAFFLVSGSLVALIGTIGLLRLPNFYQRIHGPSITTTFGLGGVLIASMLFFTVTQQRLVVHELLITLFILLSAPVVAMLLLRAALYRDLNEGKPDLEKEAYKPLD